MSELVAPPAPGIHEVTFETYLSWDAISNSRLNLARRSLLHFRENVELERTPPIFLGSLVHCGKLEPLSLAKRYAVMPDYENDAENLTQKGEKPTNAKNTSYYKRKAEDFAAINSDKEIVPEETYDRMVAIVTALAKHAGACDFLEGTGYFESAIVWADPQTGLPCKARLDKFAPDRRLVCDLKTYTPQPGYLSPAEKFTRSMATYGYHRQIAHYLSGVKTLFGIDCIGSLVVVENAEPYCVMAAPVAEAWLEIGRREVTETMGAILEAKLRDEWPGYASPATWSPPAWYDAAGAGIELVVDGETVVL
jgi:PDDEXK-like uncharacterized protein DUF3799